MKNYLITLLLLMATLGLMAEKTISGNSNSFLKQYTITASGENTFELTYSNSNAKFTIEVCPENDVCCYLLRGEQLEVMYVCNKLGFGMRRMPVAKQKLAVMDYKQRINPKAFQQQSLLSSSRKNRDEALGLIACFFPNIVQPDCLSEVFNPTENEEKSKLTAVK